MKIGKQLEEKGLSFTEMVEEKAQSEAERITMKADQVVIQSPEMATIAEGTEDFREEVEERERAWKDYLLFVRTKRKLDNPRKAFFRDLKKQYPDLYRSLIDLELRIKKTQESAIEKISNGQHVEINIGKIPRAPVNGELERKWNRLTQSLEYQFEIYKRVLKEELDDLYPAFERGKEVRQKEQEEWDELKSE